MTVTPPRNLSLSPRHPFPPMRGDQLLVYLAGETLSQLADACVALLEDGVRRRTLARAARELVERRYSWDHQAETLLALYARD